MINLFYISLYLNLLIKFTNKKFSVLFCNFKKKLTEQNKSKMGPNRTEHCSVVLPITDKYKHKLFQATLEREFKYIKINYLNYIKNLLRSINLNCIKIYKLLNINMS